MSLPEQAIQSILALPNPERCAYTLKRTAEAQLLYALADDEGDWPMTRVTGRFGRMTMTT